MFLYFHDYFSNATKPAARNLFLLVIAILTLDTFRVFRTQPCDFQAGSDIYVVEEGAEYEFNSFYMNCLLIYVGFVIIGRHNPIFARMGQILDLFLLMLYSKLIEKVSDSSKMIMTFLALAVYFAYFLIVLPRGGNLMPYQFNHYSLEGIVMWY